MAHGDCFVQGKALAPILGGQDVIARTLTLEDVLARISGHSMLRLEELLPAQWKEAKTAAKPAD